MTDTRLILHTRRYFPDGTVRLHFRHENGKHVGYLTVDRRFADHLSSGQSYTITVEHVERHVWP